MSVVRTSLSCTPEPTSLLGKLPHLTLSFSMHRNFFVLHVQLLSTHSRHLSEILKDESFNHHKDRAVHILVYPETML